jgi:hypothetical protein
VLRRSIRQWFDHDGLDQRRYERRNANLYLRFKTGLSTETTTLNHAAMSFRYTAE